MATPKVRHLHRRALNKFRHSDYFLRWLSVTAARLSTTAIAIFDQLDTSSSQAINAAADAITPKNTVLPAITGTPTSGQTLTTTNGTWTGTPAPTYARQWKRDGVAIPSATNTTYVLQAADIGKIITVTVTASNVGGSRSVNSNSVGPIA